MRMLARFAVLLLVLQAGAARAQAGNAAVSPPAKVGAADLFTALAAPDQQNQLEALQALQRTLASPQDTRSLMAARAQLDSILQTAESRQQATPPALVMSGLAARIDAAIARLEQAPRHAAPLPVAVAPVAPSAPVPVAVAPAMPPIPPALLAAAGGGPLLVLGVAVGWGMVARRRAARRLEARLLALQEQNARLLGMISAATQAAEAGPAACDATAAYGGADPALALQTTMAAARLDGMTRDAEARLHACCEAAADWQERAHILLEQCERAADAGPRLVADTLDELQARLDTGAARQGQQIGAHVAGLGAIAGAFAERLTQLTEAAFAEQAVVAAHEARALELAGQCAALATAADQLAQRGAAGIASQAEDAAASLARLGEDAAAALAAQAEAAAAALAASVAGSEAVAAQWPQLSAGLASFLAAQERAAADQGAALEETSAQARQAVEQASAAMREATATLAGAGNAAAARADGLAQAEAALVVAGARVAALGEGLAGQLQTGLEGALHAGLDVSLRGALEAWAGQNMAAVGDMEARVGVALRAAEDVLAALAARADAALVQIPAEMLQLTQAAAGLRADAAQWQQATEQAWRERTADQAQAGLAEAEVAWMGQLGARLEHSMAQLGACVDALRAEAGAARAQAAAPPPPPLIVTDALIEPVSAALRAALAPHADQLGGLVAASAGIAARLENLAAAPAPAVVVAPQPDFSDAAAHWVALAEAAAVRLTEAADEAARRMESWSVPMPESAPAENPHAAMLEAAIGEVSGALARLTAQTDSQERAAERVAEAARAVAAASSAPARGGAPLARLPGLARDAAALLDAATRCADSARQGAAPEDMVADVPGALAEIETSIQRLRGAATALAIAGDQGRMAA